VVSQIGASAPERRPKHPRDAVPPVTLDREALIEARCAAWDLQRAALDPAPRAARQRAPAPWDRSDPVPVKPRPPPTEHLYGAELPFNLGSEGRVDFRSRCRQRDRLEIR